MSRLAASKPIWPVLVLSLAGLAALPWDLPISRQLLDGGLPGELRALSHRAEPFGHAHGIIFIGLAIFLLDPSRRRSLWQLVAVVLAAGLAADGVKLLVWRVRPRAFFEAETLASHTLRGTILDYHAWSWDVLFDSSQHSVPSAHTATAVALAWLLSRWYPNGRSLFWSLAALCALNRVDGGAHWLSDVFWGAALGYAVAVACQRWAISRQRQRVPSLVRSPAVCSSEPGHERSYA